LIQTELVEGDRVVVQSPWDALSPYVLGRDRKGIEVTGSIHFTGAPDGIYELRIRIKDPESNQTVQQSIGFGLKR
jgi:hypothetical protein